MNGTRPPVLVADDEPQLRRLLTRVLERAGYEVVTAANGEEAVRALDSHAFGVAILDGTLPPGGAGTVMESIAGRSGRIGVVLTSGEALAADLSALGREQGAVFLRKPFAPSALVQAVEDTSPAGPSDGPMGGA